MLASELAQLLDRFRAGRVSRDAVLQRLQAATQTTSTGIFFQLEFTGLGQIGADDVTDLLKRNIAGYARTNPTDPSLLPPGLRPRLPFQQVF